jgi:glycosyltransferase involved in cell wall biosynthesis
VTERSGLRVALVHDWLTGMRGGEKVLDALCEIFPAAPLYTLVRVPGSVSARIEARPIHTSFVQHLPRPGRLYRHYLPLYPIAVELWDFSSYDLVISSSHCAVKSVKVPQTTVHVCYCHSPMRYAWDQFEAYFGPAQVGELKSRLMRPIMRQMARWDRATASRVDRFLANSQYVAGRIDRYYNRRSAVVHPPVDTDFYTLGSRSSSRGFLIVSALVPYKRLDLAIDACRRVGVPLTIIGTGPEEARLRALAGPDVRFLGWLPDEEIRTHYRLATATLLPGTEDFGIVPVESQACGTPVVALDAGGARETVTDGQTGVLVPEPTAEAFAAGLNRAMQIPFDPSAARTNALRFSKQQFVASIKAALDDAIAEKSGGRGVELDAASTPQAAGGAHDPVPKAAPLVEPDAARMPPAAGRADHAASKAPPVIEFDAAGMPPGVDRADHTASKAPPFVEFDAARMPPGVGRADHTASKAPPIVESDAARMPPGVGRADHTASKAPPIVEFDAARMPQPPVKADREKKK